MLMTWWKILRRYCMTLLCSFSLLPSSPPPLLPSSPYLSSFTPREMLLQQLLNFFSSVLSVHLPRQVASPCLRFACNHLDFVLVTIGYHIPHQVDAFLDDLTMVTKEEDQKAVLSKVIQRCVCVCVCMCGVH